LIKDKAPIFVAFDGDRMVGYIVVESMHYGVMYLGWVGVLESYRKQGIARKLFKSAEEWGGNNGFHKSEFETQVIGLLPLFIKQGYSLEGVGKIVGKDLITICLVKILNNRFEPGPLQGA